jgi:crotonobetainyl-CoA:carnitine CoA-transferase CaiB-like acyl-CoA transferase
VTGPVSTPERPAPPLAVLAGVRVLSFTQFMLGPMGVQYLADLGAEVVKVEPPGGSLWERHWTGANHFLNGESVFYLLNHRNQRSLALDLKRPEGLAVARRLVAEADVLVQNFRPGVMDRLGLGWGAMRALNPRLIYASASGFASDSAYRDRPGQDLLIQAISGLAWLSGRADQPPTPVGTAVVDAHGGTLLALGVLAALLERARTGEGVHVEVSMLRAALNLQAEPVHYHLNGARLDKPTSPLAGTFHPAPYGTYATADGHVVLSLAPMALLAEGLEVPALAAFAPAAGGEPWPFAEREAIARLIDPAMRRRTTAAWLERLVPMGVWIAPVQTYDETFADAATGAADAVEEIEHPVAGPVKLLRFPVAMSCGRAATRRPPPGPGEHTHEILAALGYPADAIARLRAEGVV